jgi:outer membrane biosynthesis protein TonB
MDDKIKLGALILAGYMLGRTKKMRLALTLAGAVAGNKLRDDSQRDELLGSLGGMRESLLSSPEVKRLTNEVTGKLVDAGKAAAMAAASRGIDSLNSTLQAQTDRLQPTLSRDEDEEPEDQTEEPAEDQTEEPAEDEAEDEAEEPAEDEAEEPAEDEAEEPAEDEAEEPAEDEAEEPAEEEPKPARTRSTRQKKDSGDGTKAAASRSTSSKSSSSKGTSSRSSRSSSGGTAAKKPTTTRRRSSSSSRSKS